MKNFKQFRLEVNESVEDVQELSTELLKRYTKKSKKNIKPIEKLADNIHDKGDYHEYIGDAHNLWNKKKLAKSNYKKATNFHNNANKLYKSIETRKNSINTAARKIDGVARVNARESVEDVQEASKIYKSNIAMHSLYDKKEMDDHAAYMKKTHGVKTKYYGDDELSYHGSKKAVKSALLNHYAGDKSHAKEEHPHIFNESVENIQELSTEILKIYTQK